MYGLGERHGGTLVNADWNRLVFWARDQPPHQHANLYGDHPLLVTIEPDDAGSSHGIFFLNANAKEIDLLPAPGVTWRTVGGKVL